MKIPIVSGLLSRFRTKENFDQELTAKHDSSKPMSWEDELGLTLGTLLANQESKSYGTVQAITLDEFRDSLGDMWEKYEKNIVLIADTTVERMLGKAHTVIRQDEETWLLVTPDLTETEAAHFAQSIAASIGEKLIGARFDEIEDTNPVPQSALIDLSDALNSDGSINRDALTKAVESAKSVITAQTRRKKRNLARQKAIAESKAKKSTEQSENTSAQVQHAVEAEAGLKIIYYPAWSADTQAFDTFYCRPASTDGKSPFARESVSCMRQN